MKILEIGQRVHACGATLYQKVEIFHIWGRISTPPPCADWGEILHSQAYPLGVCGSFQLPYPCRTLLPDPTRGYRPYPYP